MRHAYGLSLAVQLLYHPPSPGRAAAERPRMEVYHRDQDPDPAAGGNMSAFKKSELRPYQYPRNVGSSAK